jgi:GT2 family glycosyltransferase
VIAGARFGAVIVNYRCAPLALDAALSFLGDGGARAIIVDNASDDGSADLIADVIAGRRAHTPEAPRDPIDGRDVRFADPARLASGRLILMRAKTNGGFAAGSNIGLRAIAAAPGLDRFLLLNPDALLADGALAAFAARLHEDSAGLCGATVVAFDAPHAAQAFGGAEFNSLLLTGRNIGEGAPIAERPDRRSVEARLDYPLGAAIALRKDYLARAGYLDERYFLYYEEIDWARAGGAAHPPVWAPDAVVYHRYGAASKSERRAAGEASARSPLSDYHMTRSRVLFAAKWHPPLAPLAMLAGGAQAARRLMRGRRANAAAVFRASLPGSPRRFPFAAHTDD